MAQRTLVLGNAGMVETAVASTRAPGPSHDCEPDAGDRICTMVSECAWLQRWRVMQRPMKAAELPARRFGERKVAK